MKTCKSCDQAHFAHGFCAKHYKQAKKQGLITATRRTGLSLSERLERNSRLNTETGCIEWCGHRNHDGYGKLQFKSKLHSAHRIAWEVAYGAIPGGICVLHKCDVRHCINPDHLFLGTQVDNIADMCAKGRQAKAESAGGTKLNAKKVLAILRDERLDKEIALDYKISLSVVAQIKTGRTWKDVTGVSRHEIYRKVRGAKNHRAKLNEDAIRAIRSDIRTHVAVAADYGVCESLISSIRKRKSWRHVP